MSTPLKINLEIPAPFDQAKRQALSDVIKADAKVLGETWAAILEVEEGTETPEKTTINQEIVLGPDGIHLRTTVKAFSRKFAERTVKITPKKL